MFLQLPDHPPQYIRALMYDYRFSTKQQKKELGWWWQRELIGRFSPINSLKKEEEQELLDAQALYR